MREIKFRAWAVASKEMFMLDDESFLMAGELHSTPDTIIMQFTGLLDKNGKEIYEGDRVKHNEFTTPLVVQWDWDQWGLFDGICNEASIGKDDVEVIGNVYEG